MTLVTRFFNSELREPASRLSLNPDLLCRMA
jgi:hypothetical protein